jgi:hypothetical protein
VRSGERRRAATPGSIWVVVTCSLLVLSARSLVALLQMAAPKIGLGNLTLKQGRPLGWASGPPGHAMVRDEEVTAAFMPKVVPHGRLAWRYRDGSWEYRPWRRHQHRPGTGLFFLRIRYPSRGNVGGCDTLVHSVQAYRRSYP